jgi:20S proteasome subunit beta 2
MTLLDGASEYYAKKALKTGTTIAGVIFSDGVVLGADTRATADKIVADKKCSKIHFLSKYIYCCGAGTAADTEMTTNMISSQLSLHLLNTGREPRVCTANRLLKQHLFRYHGLVSAALVLGGVDSTGPHLTTVAPHGSTDVLPYVTMGSGSLAAMAVFEARYRPNMSGQDAIALISDAIRAGILNDLGSGSNIDLCIITKDKVATVLGAERIARPDGPRTHTFVYKKGTTNVIDKVVKPVQSLRLGTEVDNTVPMDVDG